MTDSADQTPKTTGAPRKRVRIVLFASVALNLLFVGLFVGSAAMHKFGAGRQGPPSSREVTAPYTRSFEKEDFRAMRREMRAALPDRAESMAANKADYTAFVAELRKEQFDKVAAKAIMDRQMARMAGIQTIGRTVALDRIGEMSVQDRAGYADRLQHWIDNPRKARDGKKPNR